MADARTGTASVLVVIPTYNEWDNLGPVIARIRAAVPGAHVLVVDDASPDGTGALADQIASRDPLVHVLHRAGKDGLGAAYLAGFGWALERDYAVVVQMDADGSHPPESLPAMIERLAGAELVLGSRYVRGGSVVNWPQHRQLLSRGGNLYSRVALGLPLRDITAGYRVFRREVLAELSLGDVSSQGYCFQIDMAWRVAQAGFRIAEHPIAFTERERGASKMSGSIVREALWRVTVWGAGRIRRGPRRTQDALST
ncbi:MAG: polyprenol monophosphomannose synthase [Pseudonocardia sp.]|jgi:dolichol-phosphate mannosyltransferase